MERFVPYEKLSKKEKRRLDAARRGSWGGLNPVTRKPANPRAYKRSKAWKREIPPFRALCVSARSSLSGASGTPLSAMLGYKTILV